MYNSFTEESKRVLNSAKLEMLDLKHPYIGSEHLLLALLKDKNDISDKLKNYGLTYDKFRKEIINVIGIGKNRSECFLYTPLLKRIMENAIYDSRENNNGNVTINHLFSSLLEEGEGIAIRILIGMDIDIDDLYHDFTYKLQKNQKKKKLLIEDLGVDLTKKALNGEIDPVIGRDEEIKRTIEILCRRKKNNPVLIGEAGVGKTAIVEELSRLISIGEVPNPLKGKKIISLDMSTAVAGTKYRGEFEERINKILKELEENDNIILFIDEIHTLVGAGGAEGAIDASNIFKPALARNKMRCIGATTTKEYKKSIEKDKALDRRFQKVEIKVPDKKTLKNILLRLKETYSSYHSSEISDDIIDYIIELSDKYIKNRFEPDRSIDILDEVCAHVSLKENKLIKKYNKLNDNLKNILNKKKECLIRKDYNKACIYKEEENKIMSKINKLDLDLSNKTKFLVTNQDVIEVVSRKSNVPIYKLTDYDKEEIKRIKNDLSSKIIGQEKIINELINTYKKIKLGINDDKVLSLLFTGPSGVGKTELALSFAKYVSNNVIKLDMSEYNESHQISKLIGSPAGYVGYDDNKNIFESIKDNPYSVLILDEIEMCHPNILNLLYQIFDEGKLKDSKGDDIYFNNTIIIMTSNIGYQKNNIGFNNEVKISSSLKEFLPLPLINRIDKILEFNYIDEYTIKNIINLYMNQLKNKYKNKGINIRICKNIIENIIDKSNYKEFGARKVKKIIKNDLENIIIDKILEGKTNIYIKNLKKEKVFN